MVNLRNFPTLPSSVAYAPKAVYGITTGATAAVEIYEDGSARRVQSPVNGTLIGMTIQNARAGVATTLESDTPLISVSEPTNYFATFQALAQPIESGIGTDISPSKEESPFIIMNKKVTVGMSIICTIIEQVAQTVHERIEVTFWFAAVTAVPEYFSTIGTQTATGTAAGETAMTNGIALPADCVRIKEVAFQVVDAGVASGKGISGVVRLSSTQLDGFGDVTFGHEPIPGLLAGASASARARLTYIPLNVGWKGVGTLNVYHNLMVAITTAGKFNAMVTWTKQ